MGRRPLTEYLEARENNSYKGIPYTIPGTGMSSFRTSQPASRDAEINRLGMETFNVIIASRRRYHSPRCSIATDFLKIMQRAEAHCTQSVEITVAIHLRRSISMKHGQSESKKEYSHSPKRKHYNLDPSPVSSPAKSILVATWSIRRLRVK